MALASTDLVPYASANMPVADTGTSGGAIDPTIRVIFASTAAINSALEIISSSASDTQNVTVVGRDAGGSDVTETKALNGVTAVQLSTLGSIERLLSVVLASAAAGTVTLRKTGAGTTIVTIPVGEKGAVRLFRFATIPTGGSTIRYEKFFQKNVHGSLHLQDAQLIEVAGGQATKVQYALEDAVNDNVSVAARTTAPGAADIGASGFVDTTALVMATETDAGTKDLEDGVAIGVWVKLTLASTDTPFSDTWTCQISGTST